MTMDEHESDGPHTGAPSHDKWATAAEEQDDVELFVFGDDDAAPAVTTEPALPSTVSSEDVAGDDWNDESWLHSLDSYGNNGSSPESRTDAPAGTAELSDGGDDAVGPGAFVDAAELPTHPEMDDDRLDEAIQTIAESAEPGRRSPSGDADVAGLLRELSMLSHDD
jgi:hypothetical protein